MDDFMELGESGLVPLEDGWFLEVATGNMIAPSGSVYGPDGSIVKEVVPLEDSE